MFAANVIILLFEYRYALTLLKTDQMNYKTGRYITGNKFQIRIVTCNKNKLKYF